MLLSLRSRLIVRLYPMHIAIVRIGRGWRPHATTPEILTFDPIPGQPEWQAPLAALQDWLEQSDDRAGDLHCILSNRFVRYALIPWAEDVQKPAELEIFARINMEAVLGSAHGDWIIEVDRNEYGQPAVACALDRGLMEALHDIAKGNKIRVSSIQPHFMQVFNRWRQRFNGEALFAVLDAGQCIVATFKAGAWHSLRALKLETANLEVALLRLIERELLLQGLLEETVVYVHSSGALDSNLLGQRITVLQDASLAEVSDKDGGMVATEILRCAN